MPCKIATDDDIIIAKYGKSNMGQIKEIYRRGLAYRYGKRMQCIAGIHYNFSLPQEFWSCYKKQIGYSGRLNDFISDAYFATIRNFERYAWLILYLFGASNVLCKSFFSNTTQKPNLVELDAYTFYGPLATSYRMGDFGYKSLVQQELNISYNSLDEYTADLIKAILTNNPTYQKLGLTKNGERIQLSTNTLQIENEYYGLIRPKRVAHNGERPTLALKRNGVEYLEIRCLDLNPFLPIGIDADTIRFMDCFILYCVFEDSPKITKDMMKEFRTNHQRVVVNGRDTNTMLTSREGSHALQDWATEIFKRLELTAALLDNVYGTTNYSEAVHKQKEKIANPQLTPSAMLLNNLKQSGKTFFAYMHELATEHAATHKHNLLPENINTHLKSLALESLEEQNKLETADVMPLEKYIEQYFKGFL